MVHLRSRRPEGAPAETAPGSAAVRPHRRRNADGPAAGDGLPARPSAAVAAAACPAELRHLPHPLDAAVHQTPLDPWSEDSCRDYTLTVVARRLDELPPPTIALLYREAFGSSGPATPGSAGRRSAGSGAPSPVSRGGDDVSSVTPTKPSSASALALAPSPSSCVELPEQVVEWTRQQTRDHANVTLDRISVRLVHFFRLIMLCRADGSAAAAAAAAAATSSSTRHAAAGSSAGGMIRRSAGEPLDDGRPHTAEEAAAMPPPPANAAGSASVAEFVNDDLTPARQPRPGASNTPDGSPGATAAADDVTPAKQFTPAPGNTTEASAQLAAALSGIPVVSVRKEPLLISLRNVYFDLLRVPYVAKPQAGRGSGTATSAAELAEDSGMPAPTDEANSREKPAATSAKDDTDKTTAAGDKREQRAGGRRSRTEVATVLAMDADTPPEGPSRAASAAASNKAEVSPSAEIATADARKGRSKKVVRSEVASVARVPVNDAAKKQADDEPAASAATKVKALSPSPPPSPLTIGEVLKMPRAVASAAGVGSLRMLGAEHGAPVEAAMYDFQLQSAWEAGVTAWRSSFAA